MTEIPQPIDPSDPDRQPPLAYAGPDYAARENRQPASIMVMSILAVILGSLGILCSGPGLVGQLMMLATGGRNPFLPQLPANRMSLTVYGTVASLVALVLSAALLAGGIGGLRLRPWARRAMIVWSVVILVWATLTMVITIVWINPATVDYVRRVQLQTNPRAGAMTGSMLGPFQTAAAVIRWLLACILPICFLTLWRSRKVVEAFEAPNVQPVR